MPVNERPRSGTVSSYWRAMVTAVFQIKAVDVPQLDLLKAAAALLTPERRHGDSLLLFSIMIGHTAGGGGGVDLPGSALRIMYLWHLL